MSTASKLSPAELERTLGRANAAALLHLERQIGVITGATTLPEVVEQVETNLPAIEALQAAMTEQQEVTNDLGSQVGALPPVALTPYEQHLETEVHALREMVAALTKEIEGIKQGLSQ